ncbi:hypothetical protein LTR53_013923 [Teratosphaeriaceae sp. CCFEE 6253]|nr:hypothetical protein LTR53_013923 [Teratosphaeriaceae sp. CCFEE 6253]
MSSRSTSLWLRPTSLYCILLYTLVAAASHSHPHSHGLVPRTQCYSGVFVLVSRGSEEPQGQSVLETIASGIAAAIPNSGSNEVVYPATLSFWDSAPTGVTDAQQQMQDYASQCPTGQMVLLGYSQGSYVLATALAGGNFSDESWSPIATDVGQNGRSNAMAGVWCGEADGVYRPVAAVVLFGDPNRVLGQGTAAIGTNCAETCTATAPLALTSPYNTAMSVYSDRLEHWCEANDPICCKTGHDIQTHLSYWSVNTTDSVVQFVQSKLGSNTSSSTASSSTASSATSTTALSATSSTSLPPASSSAASSSVLSAASSIESALSTKTAELAAATASAGSSSTDASSPAATPAAASASSAASAPATSGAAHHVGMTRIIVCTFAAIAVFGLY